MPITLSAELDRCQCSARPPLGAATLHGETRHPSHNRKPWISYNLT